MRIPNQNKTQPFFYIYLTYNPIKLKTLWGHGYVFLLYCGSAVALTFADALLVFTVLPKMQTQEKWVKKQPKGSEHTTRLPLATPLGWLIVSYPATSSKSWWLRKEPLHHYVRDRAVSGQPPGGGLFWFLQMWCSRVACNSRAPPLTCSTDQHDNSVCAGALIRAVIPQHSLLPNPSS